MISTAAHADGLGWTQVGVRVAHWQAGLAQEALRPGDRVAVQMRNGSDWVAFEQAALGWI